MDTAASSLPNDIKALKALVLEANWQAAAATQRAAEAEAKLANAQAVEWQRELTQDFH
jgi:transposase